MTVFETQLVDVTPIDVTPVEEYDEDNLKKEALKVARESLELEWVDLSYIIEWLKDAAERAVVESFKWNIVEDHKTRISALKQLTDLWKVANNVWKKDPQEIIFKPIFNKPPKLC